LYGKERKGFYERNRWRIEDIETINREKGNIKEEIISIIRYTEEGKIKEARQQELAEGVPIEIPIEK